MATFHEKDPFAIPGPVPERDLTESFPPDENRENSEDADNNTDESR